MIYEDNEEENWEDEEEDWDEDEEEDWDEEDDGIPYHPIQGGETLPQNRKELRDLLRSRRPRGDYSDEELGHRHESETDRFLRWKKQMDSEKPNEKKRNSRLDEMLDEIEADDIRERKAAQRRKARLQDEEEKAEAEHRRWKEKMQIRQQNWMEKRQAEREEEDRPKNGRFWGADGDPDDPFSPAGRLRALEAERKKAIEDERNELRQRRTGNWVDPRAKELDVIEEVTSAVLAVIEEKLPEQSEPTRGAVLKDGKVDFSNLTVGEIAEFARSAGIDLANSDNIIVQGLASQTAAQKGIARTLMGMAQAVSDSPRGREIREKYGFAEESPRGKRAKAKAKQERDDDEDDWDEVWDEEENENKVDHERWNKLMAEDMSGDHQLSVEQRERIMKEIEIGPDGVEELLGFSYQEMKDKIKDELSAMTKEQRAELPKPKELLKGMVWNQHLLHFKLPDETIAPRGKHVWEEAQQRQRLEAGLEAEMNDAETAVPITVGTYEGKEGSFEDELEAINTMAEENYGFTEDYEEE